ncbi:MAG: hypothetical protein JEZ06_11830 [Anaerolineaceae bacterium]|nr:hypothetical protein [Anaerolineaceae bacterium]
MANPRGRPPLDCTVTQIHLTLSLHEGRDDDVLIFFSDIPARKRAIAVLAALRAGGIIFNTVKNESKDDFEEDLDDFLFG